MASVCLAGVPTELKAKFEEQICKPNNVPDYKIKRVYVCLFGFYGIDGQKVDPSSIESCLKDEYGDKLELNHRRIKMCSMGDDKKFQAEKNVSTNRIHLSLDFYLYFYFYYLFSGNGLHR